MRKGWQVTTLGEVCKISTSLVDPRSTQYEEMQHVGGANIESETGVLLGLRSAKEEGLLSGKFIFDETMVLYSKIRPYLMKVARPDFRGLCSADIYPLSPNPTLLNRSYLFYQLLAPQFTEFAIAGSARAGMPKVNREHLFSFQILLPPLPEQQRIVGILDKAFAGLAVAVANTEKNIQNARALFESHLQSVFTQHGDGWVEKKLADCLELITYGFTNPMPTTTEGPYMITAKNVVGGRIDYASTRRTSWEAFDKLLTNKSRPHVGDVLLTKDGTLGRVAVVDQPDTCVNQSVAVLRPNARMHPQFMRCLLSSSGYQQRMVAEAGGATIKHIYITRVDKMPVTFPESIEEQQRVVASLDSITDETQRLTAIYEKKLAALAELKKSLLHQAFSGEL